jgi:hypothetical protein
MKPPNDNVLVQISDDTETSVELAEEEKDFLKSLEKMAEEIESEAEGSN